MQQLVDVSVSKRCFTPIQPQVGSVNHFYAWQWRAHTSTLQNHVRGSFSVYYPDPSSAHHLLLLKGISNLTFFLHSHFEQHAASPAKDSFVEYMPCHASADR